MISPTGPWRLAACRVIRKITEADSMKELAREEL